MVKKCTVVIDDEVNCRLGGVHPSDLEVLWGKFGVFVDGYRYMPAFQLRRWDGKLRFFEKTGKTFTKLLDEILPYLMAWDYEIDIDDKRLPVKAIIDRVDANFFKLDEKFQFREYQLNVINQLLEAGSGFGICATGSGKTSMCAALAYIFASNSTKVIIIVPSKDLVDQTVAEFEARLININNDLTIGKYSGDEKQIDHPIVVATWQSLQNAPHYMTYFQAVIVDECFSANSKVLTANGYQEISSLKPGDAVISFDETTSSFIIDEVVKLHENLNVSSSEEMYQLEFDNGTVIEVTGNHKFMTANRGFVRADKLTSDDEIINTESHAAKAEYIWREVKG